MRFNQQNLYPYPLNISLYRFSISAQKVVQIKKIKSYVKQIYGHLTMCARHMPQPHPQLVITQVRTEHVIIAII